MPFPQAPARARQILGGWRWSGFGVVGGHVDDVLDLWPNEVVQQVQVGGGGGPVREGYKVVALLLKPSLGLLGLMSQRRVLLPHPGFATGHLITPGNHHTLQHIQVHFGVDFQADFEDVRWHDVALTWNYTKDHNRSWKLCFHHPGHIPVICGNPDLHFEGAGNGPIVITWIGREHELYSGASPISPLNIVSLSDMIEGSYHSWDLYTTGQLEDGLRQKKTGIMSSFLGWQFYCSTLYYYQTLQYWNCNKNDKILTPLQPKIKFHIKKLNSHFVLK